METTIPCLTSLDTARAFVDCLEKNMHIGDMDAVELGKLER